MHGKFKPILTLLSIIILVLIALFLIDKTAKQDCKKRIDILKNGYNYGVGKIIGFHSYKGRSITVRYNVNHIEYIFDGGWDKNPNDLLLGDSVKIKYAIDQPQFILTELENEYDEL